MIRYPIQLNQEVNNLDQEKDHINLETINLNVGKNSMNLKQIQLNPEWIDMGGLSGILDLEKNNLNQ